MQYDSTMTDKEIIQGLIDRDEYITHDFFFRRCQPLIYALISRYFPGGANYDVLSKTVNAR